MKNYIIYEVDVKIAFSNMARTRKDKRALWRKKRQIIK